MSASEIIGTQDTRLPPDILLEKTDELFESLMAKLRKNSAYAEAVTKKHLGITDPKMHDHKVVFDNNSQTYTLFLFRQVGFDILFLSRALPKGFERIRLIRDNLTERAGYLLMKKQDPQTPTYSTGIVRVRWMPPAPLSDTLFLEGF